MSSEISLRLKIPRTGHVITTQGVCDGANSCRLCLIPRASELVLPLETLRELHAMLGRVVEFLEPSTA